MRATLSILGLYNFKPSIFSMLHLPTGVNRDDVIYNIIMEGAELEVLYPQAELLETLIDRWSAARVEDWRRELAALSAEYNPIENYDRTETHSDVYKRELTESGRLTGKVVDGGKNTNKIAAFNESTPQTAEISETDNTTDTTNTDSRDLGGGDNREINIRAHGNIGVTTNQEMIEAEMQMRARYNIVDIITREFLNKFCIGVY